MKLPFKTHNSKRDGTNLDRFSPCQFVPLLLHFTRFSSSYLLLSLIATLWLLRYWKKKWNEKEWGINRTERIWLKKYRQFFSFYMVQHSKSFIARVTSSFSQALLVGNIVFLPRDTILFVLACRHCNQVYILQDCALAQMAGISNPI